MALALWSLHPPGGIGRSSWLLVLKVVIIWEVKFQMKDIPSLSFSLSLSSPSSLLHPPCVCQYVCVCPDLYNSAFQINIDKVKENHVLVQDAQFLSHLPGLRPGAETEFIASTCLTFISG